MNLIGPLSDERFDLGESPVWDAERGALFWCDVHAGAIHALERATGRRSTWHFGESVGSLGLTRSGRLIVALRRSVILFEPETGKRDGLADFSFTKPGMRLNDGKVGPDGAFWIGSVHEVGFDAMEPIASLYRVRPDGGVERHVDGLKASNGLAWTTGGGTLFHSDSCGPWIDRWRFDPVSGAVTERHRIAEPDEADGRPDGGATDTEDGYWSAGTSAGVLNCYDETGRRVARVALPLPKPTMPCFGDGDMRTLFVTSRRDMLSAQERERWPLAGAVIALKAPAAGVPVHRFAD